MPDLAPISLRAQLEELLGHLAGSSSICWTDISRAGTFQDQLASSLVKNTCEAVMKLIVPALSNTKICEAERVIVLKRGAGQLGEMICDALYELQIVVVNKTGESDRCTLANAIAERILGEG